MEGFARLPATHRRALADGLDAWIDASGLADVEPAMFFEVARAAAGSRRSSGPDGSTQSPRPAKAVASGRVGRVVSRATQTKGSAQGRDRRGRA